MIGFLCRFRRPLSILPVIVAGLSYPAVAQLVGTEFQVNSYTTGRQRFPSVAGMDSVGFVVVWESEEQDGSPRSVFGQRFDLFGLPGGGEFLVNSHTTGHQFWSSVGMDGEGRFSVAWNSDDQDGSYLGVFAQWFAVGGTPVGDELQVNSYTTNSQGSSSVAANAAGDFVAVWESNSQYGWHTGIFGQRFDAVGSRIANEFQVTANTLVDGYLPRVSVDDSGGFVVVWFGASEVFGRRFDSAGLPLGNPFLVNTHTTGSQRDGAVAVGAQGQFVVVWDSLDQDGSGWGIFGQRYDSSGARVGNEFQINSFTSDHQQAPCVASDGAGNFVVAWSSRYQDGSYLSIFGQFFDSSGLRVGGEFRVNSFTTGGQELCSVAARGPKEFIVVWESLHQDGSDFGVFGQRVAFPFFSDGFESGDTCEWSASVGGGGPCSLAG